MTASKQNLQEEEECELETFCEQKMKYFWISLWHRMFQPQSYKNHIIFFEISGVIKRT